MENNEVIILKGNQDFPSAISQIQDYVENEVHSLEDYGEIELRLNQFYEFGRAFQNVSFVLLERVRKEYIDRLNRTYQKERERLLETKPRKERFSTKEVLKITGIKSETTLLKYFDNGTIKAKKDPSGRWYVEREELRKYLGHDNF